MTDDPTWPEKALAGKLFAILTASDGLFAADALKLGLESASIDKGVIYLETTAGDRFELVVRKVDR